MTDWSVVTKNGLPEYRYNNPALMRANVQPKVFDYLEANGVRFRDDVADAGRTGRRWAFCASEQYAR